MGNKQPITGVDQKELNKPNEIELKEREWFMLVDGFIRKQKLCVPDNWEIGLNHIILSFIVSKLFTHFINSSHEGHNISGSGIKYNLSNAKKHALYLNNCVGFTFNEKESIAWFHSDIHSTDLSINNSPNCQLYVFNSFCKNLYIFLNDSMHSGNDLYGSGMKYNLDEAKDFGMRLRDCKGFTFDTWRPEKEEKEGIAWFHSVILEKDTKCKSSQLLPPGSQCLYIKRDWMPGNTRDIILSSEDKKKLNMLTSI